MHQHADDGGGVQYLKTTAVVVAELLKVLFSTILFHLETGGSTGNTLALIYTEVFANWDSTLKLAIPALLYTVQNNMIFIALLNLPGLLYQISSQGKIFTTAVFSVLLLKRKLSRGQWGCMLTLALGVVAVQYRAEAGDGKAAGGGGPAKEAVQSEPSQY